jgi:maltose 6'-phosphate phosphatase
MTFLTMAYWYFPGAGIGDVKSSQLIMRVLRITLTAIVLLLVACRPGSPVQRQDAASSDFTVLTLNLHTYQEFGSEGVAESDLTDRLARERIDSYGSLFDRIAAGIKRIDPDVVCFQEVGEWSAGNTQAPDSVVFGSSDSNMARQIMQRLDEHYFVTMDWSHYGFDVWLEGSAILSKHPFIDTGSRFISNPDNGRHIFWKSRNVPMASIDHPDAGSVNVFSVHAGWWDDEEEPFQDQYTKLMAWVEEVSRPSETTILCGDFNVAAGSRGQEFMTNGTGFSDQYALANPNGLLDATIGGAIDGWENSSSGQRIDYILMNEDSSLKVEMAEIVFTEEKFGIVSDHAGVYARFRTL